METNVSQSTVKKAGKVVLRVITLAFALFALWLVVCSLTGRMPSLFGYGIVRIQSGSMEPVIHTGDFILIKKTAAEKIQAGDIITFKSDDPTIKDLPNTHRVVEVIDNGREFVTKGEANLTNDSQTAKNGRLYGRYVKTLTVLTAVFSFVAKPYVFWPVILIIIGLFIFFYYKDIKKLKSESKKADMDELIAREIEKLEQNQNTINGRDDGHDEAHDENGGRKGSADDNV